MANQNNNQYNYGMALSGRCFEMKQISEDTVMLRCSFFSRARDKQDKSKGYMAGLNAAVMCRIKGDEQHPVCDIKEADYTNKNITVWGRFYMTENHSDKTGKNYSNLNIQADKVEETVFENSNNGGQQGGWGNNG